MSNQRYLPNPDQISVIAATILLTFALVGFISLPEQDIRIELWNIYLLFSIDSQSVIMVVASILAATGSDWLIRNHPLWKKKHTLEHWVAPLLTALVMGFLISRLGSGTFVWMSYLLGAIFLMGILIAEYITVNPNDPNYPLAITILLAISYLLFLFFCILIHLLSSRLLFTLPAVFLASWLVSLRSLKLRLPQNWAFLEALLITIITTQIAAALHYWPISSLSFGLVLFGTAYALFLLIYRLRTNPYQRMVFVEPFLILTICWLLAYWFK